jgi:4-amino-4-deoxy-L-arabinose transferase-like glycosyltransferase
MRNRALLVAIACTAALWVINGVWLMGDTRPPVWDMALHQVYALNYYPAHVPSAAALPYWLRSGTYPPFVHLVIAFMFLLFHPGPHVAAAANIPATFLLFWSLYELASDLAGHAAAVWACMLALLTPFLLWMSRETILDYWLAALFLAALVLLRETKGFEVRGRSLIFGIAAALGLLTKWFFAALVAAPLLYTVVRNRLWRDRARWIHALDALMIAGWVSALWYVPNIPNLASYFAENARVGAREGEPAVFSFQSVIYYIRLLEGYQFFALLFVLLMVSVVPVLRKKLIQDAPFLWWSIGGGWITMTLLRTKDPRFTLPLLPLLVIIPAAWLASFKASPRVSAMRLGLMVLLGLQAFAITFGISWLPQELVIARGYQGSLSWDWNLYAQHYQQILGKPRREDWKQDQILQAILKDAGSNSGALSLAVIPDLPRFNSANFLLYARLRGIDLRVDHPQAVRDGVESFAGFRYLLMTEGDQGMPWTTLQNRALNQIVVDASGIFRLVGLYPLPNRDYVRLYAVKPKRPNQTETLRTSGWSEGGLW